MSLNLFRHVMQWQGYPVNKARKELRQIQLLSADEFFTWQHQARWNIARYHYNNNIFYKQKVGNTFPDRWDDLPIITKQDLQQPLHRLIPSTVSSYYKGSTSGSSGTPFFFAKDKFAHAMTWAIIADRYQQYGITDSSLQARFYGIPRETTGYYKEKFKDLVMNRIRFSVFDLSNSAMQQFVDTFRKYRFEYIYGYTNSLAVFARYLKRMQLNLKQICPSLKICISTSETSTVEDHHLFEHVFGVPHIREYGVSETCLTAFDMPDGRCALCEETLYSEIVNDSGACIDYGSEGRLVSTSLFNLALPMIRYETGDRAILQLPEVGNKYRTLFALTGRTNDTVILPSGKIAAGLTFYYIARSILEKTDCLQEFIVRQVALDHFIFDVVAQRNLTASEIDEIKQNITTYLEPGLTITVNRVPFIHRTAAGKLKHFHSEINH